MKPLLPVDDVRGRHAPSWYASTAEEPSRRSLATHRDTDVCVIGGGFTGLAAAGEPATRGHSVVLLDAHRLGRGASGRNGGQLGSGFDQSRPDLEQRLGQARARALWRIAEGAKQTVRNRRRFTNLAHASYMTIRSTGCVRAAVSL